MDALIRHTCMQNNSAHKIETSHLGKKKIVNVGLGLQFLVKHLPILQEAIDSLPSTILIKVANEENELISKKLKN